MLEIYLWNTTPIPHTHAAINAYLHLRNRRGRARAAPNLNLDNWDVRDQPDTSDANYSNAHYGSGKTTYYNWRNRIDDFANTRNF